ncbi:MAG: Uma2 family endonuclease [Deltaproteobacteria bacterium]|nr:Uma2 family endonuclease [Deltaproteobacteria bacterium]
MVGAPKKRRATYQDVLDAPEHLVAEIIDGDLRLSPRPAGPHTAAHSRLGVLLGAPFDLGQGGPGGWIILVEPELHFDDDIVVPDLAGWRRERLPFVDDVAYFTLAPDWACEVLSPSTKVHDRAEKLPIYARAGIKHVWFVNAPIRTLEILRLHEGKWLIVDIHRGDVKVRAEPFDAIELDLAVLWANLAPPPQPSRASEAAANYVL